ncbi:MAG: LTA synthase family protein [Bacilli bacterium]|nr:LTA synthase family protein [Bacilli bacterium]
MKKKLMKFFIKIKKYNYKKYIHENILFLTTVISLLINATLVRFFTVGNYFEIKPLLADLAITIFLCSFAYLFRPKKRINYYMTLSVFLTFICLANSVYYTFYTSFISVSLILTSLQISEVGDAVVENVLQLKDFVLLIQPFIVLFVYRNLKRSQYFGKEKLGYGRKIMIPNLIFAFFLFLLFFSTLTGVELSRLNNQWNREFLIMKVGVYTYQINDIVKSLEPRIHAFFGYEEVAREVADYYKNNQLEHKTNKYTNIFKGKNIITIHAESIQTFAMDLEFNDEEVTPNLNKLAREGLHFTNFYSQVGVGTSSDSEFTLNTSLMPSSIGTVFVSYWDREYITIPKLLKEQDYYSFSMHGNNGTFWNRLAMHKQLGYNRYYHKADFVIDEKIGLGLSDKSFFRQAVPKIKNIADKYKNFYGTMIMLTNHTPFSEVEAYGEFPVDMKIEVTNEEDITELVSVPYMEGTKLGNYLKATHYADEALGQFIQDLDNEGLLENTVIIIYGDHDARLPKKDYIKLYNYDPYNDEVIDKDDEMYVPVDYYTYELNRKVPFIIWTKDKKIKKEVDLVMGMYDILPTLGNMFGFHSPYQLGTDIFSVKENVVVFPNGNWLTNKLYYNNQKEEYLLLEDTVITQEYIDKYIEHADNVLTISNYIIMYDYIRRQKETEMLMQEYKE